MEQERSQSPLEPAFLPACLLNRRMGVGTAGGGGGEVKGGCGRGEPGRPGGVKLGGGGGRERRGGRRTTGSTLPPGSSSPASPGILCPRLGRYELGWSEMDSFTPTPDFVIG